MAKAPTPRRAPGAPRAEPGLAEKLTQKRRKRRRRFWKNKAREANGTPGSSAKVVAVRPPKTPADFSQNWKALQELLKHKPEAPGRPAVTSQVASNTRVKTGQQRGRAEGDATGTESTGRGAPAGAVPPGSLSSRRVPAPRVAAAGGAEPREKGTKRTDGDVSAAPVIRGKKPRAPAPPTEEDIWFDDVDPEDIEAAIGPEAASIARRRLGHSKGGVTLVKEQGFCGLTKALGMDCEMVGVGPAGDDSIVARVSIVNQFGKCVYDKYVKPTQQVTDYRTAVSGIRPENLQQGEEFEVVQKEVAEMLKGRILVGHALHNDLKVLFLDHPKKKMRDTQKYKPFKSQVQSGRPSLKLLAERILGIRLQQAEHCSIQDAQAAMRLYVMVKKEWERMARDRRPIPAARTTAVATLGRSPDTGAAPPATL